MDSDMALTLALLAVLTTFLSAIVPLFFPRRPSLAIRLSFLLLGTAGIAAAFFDPLQFVDWDQSGDCWNYDYSYQVGCDGHYQVCQDGDVYTYTLTLDGSCFQTVYEDWVAYRVVAPIVSAIRGDPVIVTVSLKLTVKSMLSPSE